jgi:hypothetical protein
MMTIPSDGELTVREGQETATDYPVCAHGQQCLIEASRHGRLYRCTRECDHDGPHIAHGPNGSGLARWP